MYSTKVKINTKKQGPWSQTESNISVLQFVNICKIGIVTSKGYCKNKWTPVKYLERLIAQSKCSINVSDDGDDDDDLSLGLDVTGDRIP